MDATHQEPEEFAVLLRRFRLAAGLSQEALAEQARISTEAVSSLERGTRKAPQRQTLALLIGALRLSESDRAQLTLSVDRSSRPRRRKPPESRGVSVMPAAPAPALSSFVDRETERATLLALLDTKRLVTIVGPGGIGKSRLALEVALAARDRFPGGTALVALAGLAGRTSLVPAIAAALGVSDEGQVPLTESISAAIGARRLLLVLDNCEHLLEVLAPAIHAIVTECPELRVITTSREALRVDGERLFQLRPLAAPDAVRLFLDRSTAVSSDGLKRETDLEVAAEICNRVDRIPLAIELTATCSDVLDLGTILNRLRERFTLPAAPSRSAPARHRTLRSLVEWSHDQLDRDEAVAFRRLAAFAGGCRLDDAEAILGFDELSKGKVLETLVRIHEKSLLDVDRGEIPRFKMLQTIRDFAAEQLTQSGEQEAVMRRYAGHYFRLASSAESDLRSAHQGAAIERLAPEFDNIRSVLPMITSNDDLAEAGLAALGALSHYWMRVGGFTEGSDTFASIDFARFTASAGLASALAGAAYIEINRGQFDLARRYAERARAAARSIHEEWLETYAAIAEHTASAALSAARAESFDLVYESAKSLGDPWLIGAAAICMGYHLAATDRDAAVRCFDYALACAQETGDAFALSTIEVRLATALAETEPRRSAELIGEALENLAPNSFLGLARCVDCLAVVALTLGREDDAALLLALAIGFQRRSGVPSPARVENIRARLGPDRVNDAVTLAGSMTRSESDVWIASFIASVRPE